MKYHWLEMIESNPSNSSSVWTEPSLVRSELKLFSIHHRTLRLNLLLWGRGKLGFHTFYLPNWTFENLAHLSFIICPLRPQWFGSPEKYRTRDLLNTIKLSSGFKTDWIGFGIHHTRSTALFLLQKKSLASVIRSIMSVKAPDNRSHDSVKRAFL